LISLFSNFLLSQNEIADNKIAIVKLKNGSVIEGEVVEWDFGNYIKLKFPWGATTVFYQEQIRKIHQKSTRYSAKIPSNIKEQGLYYNARLHLITPNEGFRAKGVFGYGLAFSAGHRFNRYLGVGAGIGYDRYIWESGENLIPLFAEINGFLNKSNTSLFYNISAGYSFTSTDEQYLLSEAKGGMMIFPSIGISWGAQTYKYTLTAGYKFQHAEFRYDSPWNFGEYSHQDVLFKRLSLSFGIIL
jgi:hypothetical protein